MSDRVERPAVYKVWVSDIVFEQMGVYVEWGEPDEDGFYTPALRRTSALDIIREDYRGNEPSHFRKARAALAETSEP